ncbi:MAG TPA: hypothetical protein VGN57_02585 [Pirellulaceae bacterium]|jgi:hypothetical protein|nr:hypothetical protein [Pirellulaceae bacterium]
MSFSLGLLAVVAFVLVLLVGASLVVVAMAMSARRSTAPQTVSDAAPCPQCGALVPLAKRNCPACGVRVS